VNGIKKNNRLIQLVMRNNQLSSEHSEDLIQIIKDHPSLSIIDLSNSELNVNKNKLRNAGVIAIVEGIL
jgi:Ran GTPase-activating protein (RanGAP) involved in mRNA processing and transport